MDGNSVSDNVLQPAPPIVESAPVQPQQGHDTEQSGMQRPNKKEKGKKGSKKLLFAGIFVIAIAAVAVLVLFGSSKPAPASTTAPTTISLLTVQTNASTNSTAVPAAPSGGILYILVANSSSHLLILNASSLVQVGNINLSLEVSNSIGVQSVFRFSPTRDKAYVSGGILGGLWQFSAATQQFSQVMQTGSFVPEQVVFAPSGAYAYIAGKNLTSGNLTVIVLNTTSNLQIGNINGFGSSTSSSFGDAAFTPSGIYAYLVALGNGSTNSTVFVINATSGKIIKRISSFGLPNGITVAPDGVYAYVVDGNNVFILNTSTQRVVGTVAGNTRLSLPETVAFAPSGAYAYVTNGASSEVTIINTTLQGTTGVISGFKTFATDVKFTPSGAYAYVLGYNRTRPTNSFGVLWMVNTTSGSIIKSARVPFAAGLKLVGIKT